MKEWRYYDPLWAQKTGQDTIPPHIFTSWTDVKSGDYVLIPQDRPYYVEGLSMNDVFCSWDKLTHSFYIRGMLFRPIAWEPTADGFIFQVTHAYLIFDKQED